MSEERGGIRSSSKEAQSTPHRVQISEEHDSEEHDSEEHNQEEDISSPEEQRPKWIRVHRKDLLPDTLNAYQLPWEWDEREPQYLLIKRCIPEDFMADLFRHTRNIREGNPVPQKTPSTVSDTHRAEDAWIRDPDTDTEPESPIRQDYDEEEEERSVFDYADSLSSDGRPVIALSDSLSFDVNLKNPSVKRTVDEFRADPAHRKYATQKVDIASSRMPGYGKVVLYRSEPTVDPDTQFSWIHMDTEMRSFDDFMRFASNVPNLAAEDRALVVSLMRKSHSKVVGMNQPNDVIRCIGLNSTSMDEATTEKCAILLRFPYYSIHKTEATQSRRSAGDKIRTLLQYYYNFDSTKNRDQEQVIRKVGLYPQDHIVHVPQMWAVIVNFRFIITSAPISLIHQGSPSLKIMDSPTEKSCSPSVICVVDPRQRVFFFPIELCKTFLAMRHNVMENCLRSKPKEPQCDSEYDYCPPAKYKERQYEPQAVFELLSTDMTVIQAEDWPRVTTSSASAIVRIHVQMLSPDPSRRQTKGRFSKVYDEPPPFYTEARDKRRFKSQNHPLPRDGVVLNSRRPTHITPVVPDLYSPPPPKKAGSLSKERTNHRKDDNHWRLDSGDKPHPIKRAATFGSLVSTESSSAEKKPTVNTGFPPVFTWPVTKRPSEQSENTDQQVKSSRVDNPDPESGNSAQSLHEDHARSTQEEIIKHVSSHIDGEIRESSSVRRSKVYQKTTEMSFFEVDKAITKRWRASISFSMIAAAGQVKGMPELPPWETALKEVVSSFCRLFNFFVPLAYPCVVGDKFWGAIHDLITILPKLCDKSRMPELAERTGRSRMTTTFYIADIAGEEHADLRDKKDLDLLIKSITYCNHCLRFPKYSKQSEAWDHLFKCHFNVSSEERALIRSRSKWVMDDGEEFMFCYRKQAQTVVNELQGYSSSLEKMASQIQHGVSENGELDRDTYRIPSSLVDAFQHFVVMVVTGAHAVKHLYQTQVKYTDRDPSLSYLVPIVAVDVADCAMEAEAAMETAIRDIILMTFTNEDSDVVSYEAVSPSLVIALVMGDIRCRDSHDNPVKLVDIYEKYVQVLQFKAGQRPNKRLMEEIYIVREELLMVEKIADEQRQILTDYCSVLNPSTFHITTQSRMSSFELEKRRLDRILDGVNDDCNLIGTLLNRLESIATQTRNGVEVRQEDQGKAIMVFTIMTVVFMPLSFVTGYFGMNTNDIRNMESSQTLFWTVSIPFTVVIIAAVLLVAFQADRVREVFDNLLWHDDVTVTMPINKPWAKTGTPAEDIKYLESPSSVDPAGKQWFPRRRVANWKAAPQGLSLA